jgi:hypothetical protein
MQVPLTDFGMESPSEFDSMMAWVQAEAKLKEKERAAHTAECATGGTTIPQQLQQQLSGPTAVQGE